LVKKRRKVKPGAFLAELEVEVAFGVAAFVGVALLVAAVFSAVVEAPLVVTSDIYAFSCGFFDPL
jgi:hypothetical protein